MLARKLRINEQTTQGLKVNDDLHLPNKVKR
jgi:hypothetical protein